MKTNKLIARGRKPVPYFSLLLLSIGLLQVFTSAQTKMEGVWSARIHGDKVNFQFKKNMEEKGLYGNDFGVKEFGEFPRETPGSFSLVRAAGKADFTGKFNGAEGTGTYVFSPDEDFRKLLVSEGISIKNERDMMDFYIVDMSAGYIQMLKNSGYTRLVKDELVSLAAVGVDSAYIRQIKDAGFARVMLQDIIPMKSLGIDKTLIGKYRDAGYPAITARDIISLVSLKITDADVKDYRKEWSAGITVNDIIEAHSAKVDPARIKELRSKGYDTNGIRKYILSQLALQ